MCGLFSKVKKEEKAREPETEMVPIKMLVMMGELHGFSVTAPTLENVAKWSEDVKNLPHATMGRHRYKAIGILYELMPPELEQQK